MNKIFDGFLLSVFAAYVAGASAAQPYPSKPVRMIVPTTPGGPANALARVLGRKLTESWGQQVVVDNRPGGHGIIAMEMLATSPPDGQTLLLGSTGVIAINTGIYAKLPYDILRDFTPVMLATKQPYLLAINAKVPAKDLHELILLAKSKPGQLYFASMGNGSGPHISMEMLKRKVGIDIVHVPYKGTAPAINDLLGGQVQIFMAGAYSLLVHVRSGRVRGLAISSDKRLPVASDVPSFSEAGVGDFEISQWQGIMAPARVPPALIEKINKDLSRAILSPEVKDMMDRDGIEVVASSPRAFATFMRAEIKRWSKVVNEVGVKID